MGKALEMLVSLILMPVALFTFMVPGYYEIQGYISPWWALLSLPATFIFVFIGAGLYTDASW